MFYNSQTLWLNYQAIMRRQGDMEFRHHKSWMQQTSGFSQPKNVMRWNQHGNFTNKIRYLEDKRNAFCEAKIFIKVTHSPAAEGIIDVLFPLVGWLIEGFEEAPLTTSKWWQMVYQTGPSIFTKRTLLEGIETTCLPPAAKNWVLWLTQYQSRKVLLPICGNIWGRFIFGKIHKYGLWII